MIEALEAAHIKAFKASDQNLAISAWICLVSMTFVWIFSLSKKAESLVVHAPLVDISLLEFISVSIYLIGIVHTEIKERK